MKTVTRVALLTAAVVVVASVPVLAQATANANLTVSAVVSARAELTLSAAAISFPDSDPATVPVIAAVGGPVSVATKAKASRNATVTVTMLSSGDFTEINGGTIPAANLLWTAAGAGCTANGDTSSTFARTLGSWTNSGTRTCVQNYSLTNGWYSVGDYTMTVTYTLTAP